MSKIPRCRRVDCWKTIRGRKQNLVWKRRTRFLSTRHFSRAAPTLPATLRGDSVGDVGWNWEGDKPLIHYRLIEVNVEDSHHLFRSSTRSPFSARLYICGENARSPELIYKTKSKYYYYRGGDGVGG